MDPIAPNQAGPALRAPHSLRWILFSFTLSLVFLFFPWHGTGLLLRPDVTALLVVYWGVFEPVLVGNGTIFVLGLLSDTASSHVLGVHALSYSLLFTLVQYYRPRILSFYRLNQMLHVLMLLMVTQLTDGVVEWVLGYAWPDWIWWLQPAIGALGWLFLPSLLERSPRSGDTPKSL
ncbi:MAG: rod shape-determining protein MreD [Ferrovum sp.]|nr:rod shape-determining protein MreD [Ferrovum sp.]NDU87869.1 rod shape-determining protein MreD [Ferrovum sp.]